MELSIRDKQISVYGEQDNDVPVVYLNTVHGEGGDVWKACKIAGCPPFTLVTIAGLDWDHDMSPWPIPAIAPGDTPCTGGADEYLTMLTEDIIPAVESGLTAKPSYRALAGYSLAGLFALYTAYQTGMFTRIASISGSMWFPDFPEYVTSHEINAAISHIYFSLGDKEAKTHNQYLKTVQENTEMIHAHFQEGGLDTIFELNPGNHFQHANERTATGIAWILK